MLSKISPYLIPGTEISDKGSYLECPVLDTSNGLQANAYYFNHPEWAEEYLTYCHRSDTFKNRWQAALGNLNGKVIVDIGCGPGNIFATLQGSPKLLIGIDVAPTSLKFAGKYGYIPVLADANKLPFISGFADVVTMNATLHHCEDMSSILSEAARIVKPGGLIVTDHDPQLSAWNFKGLAKLLWNSRLILYKIAGRGFHKTNDQQYWALKSEIHHKPGHGVTKDFFMETLVPKGFELKIYPHNHDLGGEVLQGQLGKAEIKYRLANWLSGRNPDAATSALTLMCVARKVT